MSGRRAPSSAGEKVADYADVSVESAEYNLKVFNIELGGSSVSQDGVHDLMSLDFEMVCGMYT